MIGERALTAAARQWLQGDWPAACRIWESILVDYPRDALALQCAHLSDFLLGDSNNLAGRLTRVMPAWDDEVPGYSYILGMHAFGLEECNLYEQAEEVGRRAVAIEPRDPWAVHAVTHVMEMQGRFDEGIDWLESSHHVWSPDNGFAFHNWWHLALYYLEKRDFEKVLEIYDQHIYPQPTDASMQLLDASAALWRLYLLDVDVGERWRTLANDWAAKAFTENGYYAFNDVHALMAYLGSGDQDSATEVLTSIEHAANGGSSHESINHMMSREVGLPVALALIAFNEARYEETIETLSRVRGIANRFGGSHAQRDLLTLTLIEAARRGGHPRLAAHLLNERVATRPQSPLARSLKQTLEPRN